MILIKRNGFEPYIINQGDICAQKTKVFTSVVDFDIRYLLLRLSFTCFQNLKSIHDRVIRNLAKKQNTKYKINLALNSNFQSPSTLKGNKITQQYEISQFSITEQKFTKTIQHITKQLQKQLTKQLQNFNQPSHNARPHNHQPKQLRSSK